jgi:glycosyltransferase involved in cell wall biosynthesis
MSVDVTVCVATFGDSSWVDLARERAIPSIPSDLPTVQVHGDTLHGARNHALSVVGTEWVCFLDADDELEPGYFDAMEAGTAGLRAPMVRYVSRRRPSVPIFPRVAGHEHHCSALCLAFGNWLVIGTLVRADLARQVGGFRDYPWSEDWDLWVRCVAAGATVEGIPGAVYRAHVRHDSRNRGLDPTSRMAAHRAIAEANGLPVPA